MKTLIKHAWPIACLAFAAFAPAQTPKRPAPARPFAAFDPERIFMLGDADLDARLSLDEYRDLMRTAPRSKSAGAIESMFERIDADSDGFLSIAEYRKSFPRRAVEGSLKSAPEKDMPESAAVAAPAVTAEQERFFETKIRPVLANQCGKCHSARAEKLRAGLRLDTRDGALAGGESGPVIVPGDPESSLLVRAIRYVDEDLKMPPEGKLPDAVIADFTEWVRMGAPDPRPKADAAPSAAATAPAKASDLWSLRPLLPAPPPAVHDTAWPRSEIDRFLLAALEAKGLSPVGDASKERLLRRVSFDLTGLPPTVEELDAFAKDDSPHAFEKVVDRLLDSPRFGERWGRHWLDVARYAESSGKTNFNYPHAWRYRDYVIAAFNADKPFDRFIREQIAGDLLPAEDDRDRAEKLIATGFLAIGSKAHDAEVRGQYELDLIDEQIEATSRAFQALTIACARCHDHKLDPISQRDYYALSGIFRSTQTRSGVLAGLFPNFNASPLIELPSGAHAPEAVGPLGPERRRALEKRVAELVRERDAVPPGEANRDRLRRANAMLATARWRLLIDRANGPTRAFAMGVVDRDEAGDSPFYVRGELDQPAQPVPRGLVRLLCFEGAPAIRSGSGRLELASALASPRNPLTARVFVNRAWLHLFGRGLVATPDNFGSAGTPPSHPELLDTLAAGFMHDGWSVKRLIRKIVLSRAYGLDSIFDRRGFELDPDNALIWRMSKRRLDAETLRDSLLAVAGRLSLDPPVGSAVARSGEGLGMFLRVEGQDISDTHRSVYLPVVRDQIVESLALFDFADPSLVVGERNVTTGPAQALYFMNGPLVISLSEAFAQRVCAAGDEEAGRVGLAYRLALGRSPSDRERAAALAFLRAAERSRPEGRKPSAWALFAQALFAAAEFRYYD